jgi:hypothetical protein
MRISIAVPSVTIVKPFNLYLLPTKASIGGEMPKSEVSSNGKLLFGYNELKKLLSAALVMHFHRVYRIRP